ncbi:amino acid adenylation domain-containing protein [Roseivirga sp. BDSF3-8]|uniref:non-ribosomal peptide synthetase n=1 Tax=Roseivirga sp. BDSF3-8 TaxID=3241598 RepID=UPI003531C9C2
MINTLTEILNRNAGADRHGITFIEGNAEEHYLSYKALYEKACRTLAAFKARGVHKGDQVIIQLEDNQELLVTFWSCILGGFIPVPLSVGGRSAHLEKFVAVWATMADPFWVVDKEYAERVLRFVGEKELAQPDSERTFHPSELLQYPEAATPVTVSGNEPAYVQYSSGSTGDPKGVILTHHNLVTNASDIVERSAIVEGDRLLSWMPLTHDMGMICFHLAGMVANLDQYLMPTGLFIRRPSLWVQKASAHRATHLYSPNFGYHYLLSNFDKEQSIDLSSVRLIYNGAEPISAALCREFTARFSRYGLRENAMYPGYGLAEASVAVSLPHPGSPLRVATLRRDKLQVGDKVEESPAGEETLSFVKVGRPVDHCEVCIADDYDKELPEGVAGNILIKGGNVTAGYYRNEKATGQLFTKDGWLRTGDIGLWHEGELIITGRAKNLIIINGQNYYPHDLEQVVMNALNREAGTVVACAARPADNASDELLFFLLHKKNLQAFQPLAEQVKQTVFHQLGLDVKHVLPIRQVPKTTSGKVQHFELVQQYEQGHFDEQIKELSASLPQPEQKSAASLSDTLLQVWHSLFGTYPAVGLTFAQTGLNSLQATRLASAITGKTGYPVSLKDIFESTDLSALAHTLEGRSRQNQASRIAPAPESDSYPVTFQQQRFWYLDQLSQGMPVALIPLLFHISGPMDKTALSVAWDGLIKRHESLRTVFAPQGKEIRQKVLPASDVRFAMEYIKGMADRQIADDIKGRTKEPFDLANGPLAEAILYELDRQHYILFIKLHHSIADGWSANVLLRDLSALYNTQVSETAGPLAPLPFQQKDIAAYRHELTEQAHKAYWEKELGGYRSATDFWNKSGYEAAPFEGGRSQTSLPAAVNKGLQEMAANEGGTLFMSLLTGVATWLHAYTGKRDFIIASDFAGRNIPGMEDQVGCHLNSVPLRIRIQQGTSGRELFAQVKEKVLNAAAHQSYPAEQLISSGDQSAPYHVLLILQNFSELLPLRLNELEVEVKEEPETSTCLTDLHLECIPAGDTLNLTIRYSRQVFSAEEIKEVSTELIKTLATLPAGPEELISSNKEIKDEPSEDRFASVFSLFEKAAAQYPERTAIRCGEAIISYQELSEKVNILADYLDQSIPAKTGKAIAIMLPPSIDRLTAMLAIQKVARPFLPIDPAYPADRVAFMLDDARAGLLLTDQQVPAEWEVKAVNPEEIYQTEHAGGTTGETDAEKAAYILYTSGTTGRPKGVVISQDAFSHYVRTFAQYFGINENDRVIQQASPSFDTILEEVFPTLISGGQVVIAQEGGRNVQALRKLIREEKATVLSTTPLVINELNKNIDGLDSLRLLISGGDALQASHINHIVGQKTDVFNTYGPTETTVCATWYKVDSPAEASVIGKAVPGKEVWLLDEQLEEVEDEVPGELYIGGKGLALGYLNRPEEEGNRFITSPYNSSEKLYRTGDLARRRADGCLVFIGRKDRQVKIRGHRVEPAEVEATLTGKGILPEVIIQVKRNPAGEKVLVAYHTRPDLLESDLRQSAAQILPDYMVPGLFVGLQQYPLTANGKVDKRALPDPFEAPQSSVAKPASLLEEQILAIWQDLHGEKSTSVTQNFFAAGGNSISAVQLAARVSKLTGSELRVQDVFLHPTVREIAELLAVKEPDQKASGITEAPVQTYYPVSHAQKRMWLLQQTGGQHTAYNLSWAFELQGILHPDQLQEALQHLVARHPALRTRFKEAEGEVIQQVMPSDEAKIAFRYDDLANETTEQIREKLSQIFHSPFTLEEAPLMRAGLYKTGKDSHVFYLSLHHIIADGWSVNVLAAELATVYNALVNDARPELPGTALTPADYAIWERAQAFEESEKYWLDHLSGELPVLEMPADKARPADRTFTGRSLSFRLEKELVERLRRLCSEQQTTPFAVLLAATKALLYKYTGKSDIILGTPVALRDDNGLQGQVGNLLNTLALRTSFEASQPFTILLEKVSETIRSGYAHKYYPFDKLVDKLDPEIAPGHSPLFDIMVGYQEKEAAYQELNNIDGVQAHEIAWEQQYSQFDLSIDFFGNKNSLDMRLEYSDEVFSEDFILRLQAHFKQLLDEALNDPNQPLAALDYLSPQEKGRLLRQGGEALPEAEYAATFLQRIEKQAAIQPDKVAIRYQNQIITYRQLNDQANQVARLLIEDYKVGQGAAVGLMSHASPEAVVLLLGIIKAGAVFVPIDPVYPVERVQHIISQSNLALLIGEDEEHEQVNKVLRAAAAKSTAKPEISTGPDDLIYIIHTSGSTGLPKGVAITHRNVQGMTASWQKAYGLNDFDVRSLAVASIAFDVFFGDLSRTLCFGGELVICPVESKTDPALLLHLLQGHHISFMEATPGLVVPLFDEASRTGHTFPDLKLLVVGSDVFAAADYNRLRAQLPDTTRLINSFGTTETTIDSSFFEAGKNETLREGIVPIGKPLPGVAYYILDADKSLLPAGIPGELYIGGVGVGKGYINRPELTAERFVSHPFKANETLYRSGDLCRWREDGTLEYLGRADEQVKLRGYRIEPAEIAQVLKKYEGIEQAVVIKGEDQSGDGYLAAYYTGSEAEETALRSHLQAHLPGYMVPQWLTHMDSLPLTPNGKVDKKNLPAPDIDQANLPAEELTAMEQSVSDIWQQVLGRKHIRLEDNFFTIGGHSLKAMQVVMAVYRDLGIKLDLRDLFRQPTLRELAAHLAQSTAEGYAPIERAPAQATYPLSHGQHRIWMLSQQEGGSQAYNMVSAYKLSRLPEASTFRKALQKLSDRHEILRTTFHMEAGQVIQKIKPAGTAAFAFYAHTAGTATDELIEAEQSHLFDLENGPLLRCHLAATADGGLLLFNMHHIISDGWSGEVLVDELVQLYEALEKGHDPALEAPGIQYKDYVFWQQEQLAQNGESQLAYWKERFKDGAPVLELPKDSRREGQKQYQGGKEEIVLAESLFSQLKETGQQAGASPFMVLLSALDVLLYRYTGQDDLVIGTAVSGREHPQLERQAGFYVNTLALRQQVKGEESFSSLLSAVKRNTTEDFARQAYPYDLLVEALDTDKLFDVMFLWEETTLDGRRIEDLAGLGIEEAPVPSPTSKFDLLLTARKTQDGSLKLIAEYDSQLYRPERMQRLLAHYQHLLSQLLTQPEIILHQVSYTTEEEQQSVLSFGQGEKVYPVNATLHELFSKQVASTPEAIALRDGTRELSYAELDRRSDSVATWLQANHPQVRNEVTGLMCGRSIDLMVAIFGVLKAGGSYCPIDKSYPQERISYMLEDCGIRLILTDGLPEAISFEGITPALIETISQGETKPAEVASSPDDTAYVLYTSGTTGRPKGVAIPHKGVVNLSHWLGEKIYSQGAKTAMLTASTNFDASVQQLYAPLLNGATLILLPEDEKRDPAHYLERLREYQVDVLDITPSYLSLLLDSMAEKPYNGLRYTLVGGEALDTKLAERYSKLAGKDSLLLNVYGVTECTVDSTCEEIREGERLSENNIGSVIPNTEVLVLDRNQQPAGIGIPGELYIGGVGVGKGYLNRPELTAERFVSHPFKANETLYRSGDLCRWREDGTLEYLGRADEQVKLRGYRIEPAEIAQVLKKYEGIEQAVVIKGEDQSGDGYLAAYYTGSEAEETALRSHLQAHLPGYMVPQWLTHMDSLPLTPNGKVDKKNLPAPDIDQANLPAEELTAMEQSVSDIWQQVLGRKHIRLEDNFFTIGGHSLKAMQVVMAVYRDLGIKLDLRDLFRQPTLRELAAHLAQSTAEGYAPIERAPAQATYPLSHGQHRIWMLSQQEGGSQAYNMVSAYKLSRLPEASTFRKALQKLSDRHEILRTTFHMEAGQVIQKIKPAGTAAFAFHAHTAGTATDELIEAEQSHLFDLENGPLLRCHLAATADGGLLLFNMHHIISDGWSGEVLVDELVQLYEALEKGHDPALEAPGIQYKDYVFWQQEQLAQNGESQLAYWKERFKDGAPVLELPKDSRREGQKQYQGGKEEIVLAESLFSQLKETGQQAGASPFMVLLSALDVLLYRYTGQDDLVIGTAVSGREHPQLERQAGFYVNTLALRQQVKGEESFSSLLSAVKRNTTEDFARQAYPYDLLVEALDTDKLFDVMFLWEETTLDGRRIEDLAGLGIEEAPVPSPTSKFDLLLTARKTQDGSLKLIAEYDSQLYRPQRMQRLLAHYQHLLSQLLAQPEIILHQVSYTTEEEQQSVLSFGQGEKVYPVNATLHELFSKQVARTPDAIALRDATRELSYAELDRRSDSIATWLQANHPQVRNEVTGLMCGRSIDLMVAIFGILKAGGSYCPIDKSYPQERISYMLEDCGIRLILTDGLPEALHLEGRQVIEIETISQGETKPAEVSSSPDDTAYVLYTSGTTGRPKGVAIPHKGVVNLSHWLGEKIYSQGAKTAMLTASTNFDASVQQLYAPLLNGTTLVLLPEDEKRDPAHYLERLREYQVDVLDITPSYLSLLLDSMAEKPYNGLRYTLVGGEALDTKLAERYSKLAGKDSLLLNVYGVTECTVDSTCEEIREGERLSENNIGSVIPNTEVFVLDRNQQPAGIGIPGELYIGGVGVGKGYINRPELTAERFVSHPFKANETLYRSGDLCRWREDGTLEYLGRADEQVKLRGYRIEPAEIAQVLTRYEGIEQAVVIKGEDESGDGYLAGYYTGHEVDETALRSHLQAHLPGYMVPQWLTHMDSLPLTQNGKIDRRRLPDPAPEHTQVAGEAEELSPVEQSLKESWQEVLGHDAFSAADNFFSVGGNSVKVIRLYRLIDAQYPGMVQVHQLFSHPTIRKQAALVAPVGKEEPMESSAGKNLIEF